MTKTAKKLPDCPSCAGNRNVYEDGGRNYYCRTCQQGFGETNEGKEYIRMEDDKNCYPKHFTDEWQALFLPCPIPPEFPKRGKAGKP